jgi:Aspartyl protease
MSCIPNSYTYPISRSNQGGFLGLGGTPGNENTKYYITVKILGADNQRWIGVRLIADTGNDVTLLTKNTADMLGFHEGMGTLLQVSGIRKGMISRFEQINTYIQLGDLTPVNATIAYALDDDSLQENLLGNKGILASGNFEFRYDNDSLTIYDRINACDMTTGMMKEKNRYSDMNKNRENNFWSMYTSRNFYYAYD